MTTPRKGFGYTSSLAGFLDASVEAVLGSLAAYAAELRPWATVDNAQVVAWEESIGWLREAGRELLREDVGFADWTVCLEYDIPRRGGRIDATLLAAELVIVIEFKATNADLAARRQAEDYGLELLDFHKESHGRTILPVVCAKKAPFQVEDLGATWGVARVSTCAPESLAKALLESFRSHHDPRSIPIDRLAWLRAPYIPTPTIIEAARTLYAGHTIRELSQSEAGAEQLRKTQETVADALRASIENRERTICFITGIPGAGKTLAGLNVVHSIPDEHKATYLSGNGPLVKVLQEVLAKDMARRDGKTMDAARRESKTLVTNVHKWLDEYISRDPSRVPYEDVVVFDEAQRAWNQEQSRRKFKRDSSEPEMMLEAMSRREVAVVVCLVGGGQEINTGEAGLSEWGRALKARFADWKILLSNCPAL